ncbi:MAG: TolC family protein [Deltaproteobacteria bacterium]|nr:TolC family protein [Deltaproteobacteria bacterium]
MKQVLFILLISCLLTTVAWSQEEQEPVGPDFSGIEVLDLETAQRIALKGNPGIVAAQARLEQARARVKQAVAAWWPILDVTGTAARTRRSDNVYEFANLPGQSADRTYNSSAAGLQATWVLFDGFFRSFKQEQMEFGEKSSAAARRDSQRLLVSAVAEAFLNAQLTQTKVKIAEADKKFYKKQLLDANNRFEVGTGPWGDVLNIKVQLNSARTSAMFGKREYEAAQYGLAALLGVPDSTFPETVSLAELDRDFKPSGDLEKDAQGLIDEALATRPDLRRLSMQVHEAEAATGQAKAAFWPKVQLGGTVNGAQQGDVALTGEDFGNSVSVSAAWNLFSGGADRARVFEAEQKRREVLYSRADLRNRVASEVRQDIALLAAAREQVRLQRESVGLVEENRQLAESEYEAGSASLVRLNEAQRDLTTTYGRLAQSLVGYHLARQRLLAATGHNLTPFAEEISEDAAEDATE